MDYDRVNKKKKILIADDDHAILDAISLLLKEVGYDVKTTMDGKTIHDFNDYQPDLLLLDIWMTGWDGRDICKELKSGEKTKNTPIIMISANKDTARIAKEAGADDFISKPFELNILLAKIARHIGASQ
jgi:DNA-binding response OmpR family regulator